jgi:hypothetical protein
MSDPQTDEMDRVRRLVADRLEPDGWNVSVEPSRVESEFEVRLDHPLSHQINFSFSHCRERTSDTLDRFLASAEVAAVGQAPASAPNAALIRGLRNAASAGEWPEGVLGELALVLRNHGILTDEEMIWLSHTGAIRSVSEP